jgi:hypothetical protein
MRILMKILLVVIYPLLLVARFANVVRGRDRLRLHEAPSGESCWIERRGQPNTMFYFSEESNSEAGGEPSAARLLFLLLQSISRLWTPPERAGGVAYKSSTDRERGIPDEVYTLW